MTWYDLCQKQKYKVKIWPEGTPDECKYSNRNCYGYEPTIRNRCLAEITPLDFIYEKSYNGYNFERFKTDDDIV